MSQVSLFIGIGLTSTIFPYCIMRKSYHKRDIDKITSSCTNLSTIRHPVRFISRLILKWLIYENGRALKNRSDLVLTIRTLQDIIQNI